MWDQALTGIKKHLLTYSSPSNFLVLAERPNGLEAKLEAKMDHLVCFLPGTIALGVTGGDSVEEAQKARKWTAKDDENMEVAKELMKTCWGMYATTETRLAPEISYFNIHDPPLMYEDFSTKSELAPKSPPVANLASRDPTAGWRNDYVIKPMDTHNLQRPETVESLFYMWRITGDEIYRQWGWEMFQSFINYTTVGEGAGFSSIRDVTKTSEDGHGWRDNMESFWLVSTLLREPLKACTDMNKGRDSQISLPPLLSRGLVTARQSGVQYRGTSTAALRHGPAVQDWLESQTEGSRRQHTQDGTVQ